MIWSHIYCITVPSFIGIYSCVISLWKWVAKSTLPLATATFNKFSEVPSGKSFYKFSKSIKPSSVKIVAELTAHFPVVVSDNIAHSA